MENKRTLKQLLVWFVSVLLLLLLLGNLLLNINITKNYLQTQLVSHAQDAATSLGLSLSNVIDARDQIAAERMIDAIFDSGDYRRIDFYDIHRKPVIQRQQDILIEGIPSWFIDSLPLKTPVQSAEVMGGWNRLGTLVIQSHPGYAYIELWQVFKTQLLWFCGIGLAGLLLMRFIISLLLRPLHQIEDQAHEMALKRFDYRAPTPKTRELAKVAEAMNEMADTLGHVFNDQLELIEGLREQSVLDPLTGLHNREGFDRRLKADLESEDNVPQGSLYILHLRDFEHINQQIGREKGDELLLAIGRTLKETVQQHSGSYASRRTGSDFSLFFPSITDDSADDLATNLMSRLSSLASVKHLLRDDLIHMGVACFRPNDNCASLLSKSDMALRQAQSKNVSAWQRYAHIAPDQMLDEVRQANEWHSILQEVLAKQSVILHLQPVYKVNDKTVLYHQVLARLEIDERLVVAGLFLPMVERFDLSSEFDRMIVTKATRILQEQRFTQALCISLSEQSLGNEAFLSWLEQHFSSLLLKQDQLIFEVPEHIVNYTEPALIRLCELAKRCHFEISIERFGASSVPFSYLQRIAVNVIKVDQSFIRGVQENQANQFFLKTAIQIAHSQGIKIVAVGVESEAEWLTLKELGMDGAMGYYLAKPEAIPS